MNAIPRILLIVLFIIGIIVTIMSFTAPTVEDDPSGAMHNYILYYSYTLSILAVVGALIAAAVSIINNPASLIKLLIWLGVFGAVVGIAYGLASGSDVAKFAEMDITISESGSRWSGASLYTFYLLGGLAIGSILFSSVYRFIK